MRDFEFLEPLPKTVVSVKLPSRGVPYPEGTPPASGKINLSPMTMIDEAVFAEDGVTLTEAIDRVLRRCVQEKLDINTLLVSDKFFLFMMLRAITYGEDYEFGWTCAQLGCGFDNKSTVKIPNDFKMKQLADTDKEPFIVTLPDSQKEISFRLLRGVDEPAVEAYRKKIKAQQSDTMKVQDTTPLFRVCRHIIAVDGNPVKEASDQQVMKFFASLSAKDRQFFQAKIALYTPGIDTELKVTCDKCGYVHRMEMPFSANFFRAISDDEEIPTMADEIRPDVLSEDRL